MTCGEALELIAALLDGELAVPDIARLERHLSDCDGCRAAHASEAWLHAVLAAGALAEAPSDHLRRRIAEAVRAEAARAERPGLRWRRALGPAMLGTAACLVAAALIIAPDHLETARSPMLRGAVADHEQYAADGRALLDLDAEDADRVERWIRDRLGLVVELPSEAASGESVVGARVTAVAGGAAAHVVYAGRGHRLSLFVAPRPPRPLPEEGERVVDGVEVYTATLGGASVSWWQDTNHLYLAVSTTGIDDLLALAARCIRGQRSPGAPPAAPDPGPSRAGRPPPGIGEARPARNAEI